MSQEIRVSVTLSVRKGLTQYARSFSAVADFNGAVGPSPGVFVVYARHTAVDLSKLASLGGWAALYHTGLGNDGSTLLTDGSNFVEWGIYDPIDGDFIPVGELYPGGEPALLRLSRYLGAEQLSGTGTGAYTGSPQLAMKSVGLVAPLGAVVGVDAFDA